MAGPCYVFLDEAGNFDFSRSGTRVLTFVGVVGRRPFLLDAALADLRFELIEAGLDLERFHASEDRQAVRDRVFALIRGHLNAFRVHGIVVEKRKLEPASRSHERLYPMVVHRLLTDVIEGLAGTGDSKMVVITDRLPLTARRSAIEKGIKTTLARHLPAHVDYRVLHHASASSAGLQIADYFNWALFRAWERDDRRSLAPIQSAFATQIDLLSDSATVWY